ncbi:MAG: TolC family protein [Verrucomicrobiota bacterium]
MNVATPSVVILCAGVAGLATFSARAASAPDGKSKTPQVQAQAQTQAPAQPADRNFGSTLRKRSIAGDLKLIDAVNLALHQNPEVLRSVREIERTHGQIVEARAQALPHLSVDTTLNRQDSKLTGASGGFTDSLTIAFSVKQVLYSGGQVSSALEVAKLTQDVTFFNLRDILDRTVSDVRKQFAQVLVTAALIDVAQESVELAAKQLEDASNRFAAGTVPRFNVLRAEVELASVKPGLIRAKNDYLIAQLQLAKLLGLDALPDGKLSFKCVGDLTVRDIPFGLADGLSLSRARRASLKSQRQQILVEKERINIANAGYKPRIDAHADYQFVSKGSSRNLESYLNGYFLGITGKWNIFDSFETAGQVSQAKARFESALLTYDESVLQVELEVQRSYADLLQFRETIESQQKNVQQALEALRLAQERLAAGAGTQLEVLDARVVLTRARQTALQAQGDYVRSLAEYERATATNTVYAESFKDPLSILEKRVLKQSPAEAFSPADLFKK